MMRENIGNNTAINRLVNEALIHYANRQQELGFNMLEESAQQPNQYNTWLNERLGEVL